MKKKPQGQLTSIKMDILTYFWPWPNTQKVYFYFIARVSNSVSLFSNAFKLKESSNFHRVFRSNIARK